MKTAKRIIEVIALLILIILISYCMFTFRNLVGGR